MAAQKSLGSISQPNERGLLKNGALEQQSEKNRWKFWNGNSRVFFVHQVANVP